VGRRELDAVAVGMSKFQFTNRAAQRAEALLNAHEALALVERHVPVGLRNAVQPATTEAGACFRRVCVYLTEGNPLWAPINSAPGSASAARPRNR
jgi:hypothetical protein